MTEVLLFHHAQGQTTGFHAFADELRGAGTRCTLPTSSTAALSTASTKAWHSSGSSASARSSTAASVRQTNCPTSSSTPDSRSAWCRRRSSLRPVRAREVLLFYSCVPVSEFGPWPAGVPAQIHGMDADPLFVDEGDIDAAQSLRRVRGGRRAVPLPRRSALFRRFQPALVRPGRNCLARPTRSRVPRRTELD